MANSITKAVAYLADPENINAVYKAASKSIDLDAQKIQILAANVVKLPKFSFGGALGDYDRATGFVANDLTKAWDTYTLSQDKGNKIILDVMDDEETLGEGVIKAFNEYQRQVVVPAVDTYKFSVLVANAGTTKALTLTAANILTELYTAEATLTENEVPEEGRILYIPAAKLQLLKSSTEMTRFFSVRDAEVNGINTKFEYFNDAKIVVVPQARLGANTQFIYVHPSAVASCTKHNPARYFAAGTYPGVDADEIDYRLYYDLFAIANKVKGIYLQTVTV